jgi:hypothetical protein
MADAISGTIQSRLGNSDFNRLLTLQKGAMSVGFIPRCGHLAQEHAARCTNDMVCLWVPLSLGKRGTVYWPQ